uniref:Calponin-homology (CH) domain-containing protein n=1 Tax=Tetradesmus obliquus TaxID=3088 RepID=A0A383WH49_TETOB|eukprot:jgi/Sobl393_1/17016/SZX76434.1
MSTLASLPREVLKWLLSLDLSYTVRHIKRDFSNGFLFAEILCRYYPADVQMHSFENVTSIERKRANWVVLERLFKKRNIPIEQQQVEAIINAEGDAASEVLQAVYSFINSEAYRESVNPSVVQQQPTSSSPSQHVSRQHSFSKQQHSIGRQPSTGRSRSNGRGQEAAVTGYCYGPDGALYPTYASEQEAQMWQMMMYQQQQAALSAAGSTAYMQQVQAYGQMMGALGVAPDGTLLPAPEGAAGSSALDELAFNKKPRPVEFEPYKMADYEARNYDAKKANGYWQLGRLGPEETEELQAKREAKERVRELSNRIKSANAERLAAAAPARAKPKEPSARQRAVEYAKSSVPRPELLKQRSGAGGRSSGRQRGSRSGSEAGSTSGADEQQDGGSQLEQLQQQHELYAQQVEQIRQELERSLGAMTEQQ